MGHRLVRSELEVLGARVLVVELEPETDHHVRLTYELHVEDGYTIAFLLFALDGTILRDTLKVDYMPAPWDTQEFAQAVTAALIPLALKGLADWFPAARRAQYELFLMRARRTLSEKIAELEKAERELLSLEERRGYFEKRNHVSEK